MELLTFFHKNSNACEKKLVIASFYCSYLSGRPGLMLVQYFGYSYRQLDVMVLQKHVAPSISHQV